MQRAGWRSLLANDYPNGAGIGETKTWWRGGGGITRRAGAPLARGRIAERAHQGVRRTDGENRPGSVPGSVLAQAGEGCRNADRADLYSDDRGPVSVREKPGGGRFSGVKPWRRNSGEERDA